MPPQEQPAAAGRRGRPSLSTLILLGLIAGIACGLFFGDFCRPLEIVGNAFMGLLQMTVLPYIMVSLTAKLGGLAVGQSKRLARAAGAVFLLLLAVGALAILLFSLVLPPWTQGSFFSTCLLAVPEKVDFVTLLVPTNLFQALTQHVVPAVVVFCIFLGVALTRMEHKEPLLAQLELLTQALVEINHVVIRFTPLGVFAVAASAAGTMTIEEFGRVQVYLLTYTLAVLGLCFWLLPNLIASCTPFSRREIWLASRDALVTAFATGKVLVVLPMLIENTKLLLKRRESQAPDAAETVEVLYPLAFPFPHLGRLMGLLFIPFAAWFSGRPLELADYPSFLALGNLSFFGGPVVAIPFLLEQMRLPSDLFQLFVATGVYCGRLGDMLGVMHLLTFVVLTACLSAGLIRIEWRRLIWQCGLSGILLAATLGGVHFGIRAMLTAMDTKEDFLADMNLLDAPVPAVVAKVAAPNPTHLEPGQSRLDRIRERGVVRVGYNADELPFAYFNAADELVGLDVNLAHVLARDLGVSLEFVPFTNETLATQLKADHFDIGMSGILGTATNLRNMPHALCYLDVNPALVVRDHHARRFSTFDSIRQRGRLRVGVVGNLGVLHGRTAAALPQLELVPIKSHAEFFAGQRSDLEALLTSAQAGSAWTLIYPDYRVVIPDEARSMAVPLIYPLPGADDDWERFLANWIELRRKEGTVSRLVDHWILGRGARQPVRRWCLVRDVLHWVK
jgi:Na+/H+-dicarboxylate symporter/ABC-type amino acid transport substrate-binding protein